MNKEVHSGAKPRLRSSAAGRPGRERALRAQLEQELRATIRSRAPRGGRAFAIDARTCR